MKTLIKRNGAGENHRPFFSAKTLKKICLFLAVLCYTNIASAQYKVGDIYEKDGVKAVIYYVNNSNGKGLAITVSENQTLDVWHEMQEKLKTAKKNEKKALKSDIKEVEKSIKAHYNALVALTNSYGKNNTQVIKDYCAKNNIDISTYFPAIAWAESLGEGWFVPGIYEAAHYAKYIAWGVGKQSYKGTNKKDITNKYKERNEQLQSHPGYENCNLPTSIRTSSIGSNSMSIYGVKSSWCIDHRLELREEQSEAGIGSLKFSYRSDCYYDIEPYRPMMGMGTWVSYCKVAVCEVDCNAAPEAPVAEANDADAPKAEANDTDAPKTETNDADAPKAETNDTETTSL